MEPPSPSNQRIDRAIACLLGGALGDALGAPVEFLSLEQIKAKYGPEGIQELDRAYGRVGAITDDTQMSLFSAEGLIRANVHSGTGSVHDRVDQVGFAYRRWLHTQGEQCLSAAMESSRAGWLVSNAELHDRRAPGNTCLSGLRAWRGDEATNTSKGCGTVMRSAPFGFFPDPWESAWHCAAITHGHIEAKSAAAIFATAIRNALLGADLPQALGAACDLDSDGTKSSDLLRRAVYLAEESDPPDDAIAALGAGWVAEEALAIGAYCALKAVNDFRLGVRLAVNHGGDSDSTGSICGNLLGVYLGLDALPTTWLGQLELREVIEEVAIDMASPVPTCNGRESVSGAEFQAPQFLKRYPSC